MATSSSPSKLGLILKAFVTQLALLVLLVAFTLGGAKLFMRLEGSHETHEKYDIIEMRREVIDTLWNTSHRLSIDGKGFTKFVKEELKRYEAQLYTAFSHGINSHSEEQVWDLWGSLIYCTTIYTTVGYGHMAPATDKGRIATMVYGLVGIPLCLIVLAEMGKFLTLCLKYKISLFRRLTSGNKGSCDYVVDDEFNVSPLVAIGVMISYILVGAAMYKQWEDWDYLEAFYFIFISISTVGFGDVLPSDKKYFLGSFVYQLFGLALVAMVINVVMEVLQRRMDQAGDSFAAVGVKLGIPLGTPEDKDKKMK